MNATIKSLEARAEKLRRFQSQLEKSLAVNQHKIVELKTKLSELGVDVEDMKPKAIRSLKEEMESELSTNLASLEKAIEAAEAVVEEFNEKAEL